MQASESYRQKVLTYIDEIKKKRKQVVIFGAGRGGWYIMKVFEHYGVSINSFADNDPCKHGTYFNYPVRSPVDISREIPDAHIFLGLFSPNTADVVREQLVKLKFRHIHYSLDAFLYLYLTIVAGRKCDKEVLAESIRILFENYAAGPNHYGYTETNNFVSPFVTSVITQKCSLRCRDCAQLIPYYNAPVHFSVQSIINDLRQYAKAFDVVPEISLHGGEPFLHPDIQEICREAAGIPNIVFISFVTNGTIMLADETLQELSACGADVHQSGGYGSLSRKKDELCEAFRRHNIYSDVMFCSPTEMWNQPPPTKKHARVASANDALYKRCASSKTCCQIMDGELHRCSLSMHGSHQGLFPKRDNDFVHLHDPDTSDSILVAKMRSFLGRDGGLSVCDYCDPDGGKLVPPAIQLART